MSEDFRIGSPKWSAERPGELNHLTLDVATKELRFEGHTVHLTPIEFQMLWLLNRANGNFVSESEFMEFIYNDNDADLPVSNVIEKRVGDLRKKISDAGLHLEITNKKGFGYRLGRTPRNG